MCWVVMGELLRGRQQRHKGKGVGVGGWRGWVSASDSCPGHSQEMQTAKLVDKLTCRYPKKRAR